jgi:hypothetical protein
MGMDVMGLKPTSNDGKYFRSSHDMWAPLWRYCAQLAPDLIDGDLAHRGLYNDGAGLCAKDAAQLAERLSQVRMKIQLAQASSKKVAVLMQAPTFIAFLRDCGGFAIW